MILNPLFYFGWESTSSIQIPIGALICGQSCAVTVGMACECSSLLLLNFSAHSVSIALHNKVVYFQKCAFLEADETFEMLPL